MPEGAKPGDVLLLTKALGTQVRLTKKKGGSIRQKNNILSEAPFSFKRPPLVHMSAWKSMLSSLKASHRLLSMHTSGSRKRGSDGRR